MSNSTRNLVSLVATMMALAACGAKPAVAPASAAGSYHGVPTYPVADASP